MDIYKIIPQIQQIDFWDTDTTIKPENITLKIPTNDFRIISLAKSIFENVTITYGNPDTFCLFSKKTPQNTGSKGFDFYSVLIDNFDIQIFSKTERGFFYALNTLKKIQADKGTFYRSSFTDWADVDFRCDYIEFRNYYPKFKNILKYFEEMADRHTNSIILEMEDKRPTNTTLFTPDYVSGFSKEQIQTLCDVAYDNFIEIIPLQQSFGHLEYLLKQEKYEHMREVFEQTGELCPSNPESILVISELIKDIAEIFPNSNYIHLGCDEVRYLNLCDTCTSRNLSNNELVIEFLNKIIDATCKIGKKPLIWHDMLQNCTEQEIELLDKRAIVVVWLYDGSNMKYHARHLLTLLKNANLEVLGGLAVRCFDSEPLQNYPPLSNRFLNILQWKDLIHEYSLQGIVNTNWASGSAISAPYGIYETSIYPNYFACEQMWNKNADQDTFLSRFLQNYHQIDDLIILNQGYTILDYYIVLAKLVDIVQKGKDFAKFTQIVERYIDATSRVYPYAWHIYRVKADPTSFVEWETLRTKYFKTSNALAEIKPVFNEMLSVFLPEACVNSYICSRYEHWEIFEKEVLALANEHNISGFKNFLT